MDIYVPDYYKDFHCIADKCKHTCCQGWEVEVDEESLSRFQPFPDIMKHIETSEDVHFRLVDDEKCPFLLPNGLCDMISKYGENMLCQICADHPRFRNYWSDRIEMGLGLVCEEAARIVLSREIPMKLIKLAVNDEEPDTPSEEEQWLMSLRDKMLAEVSGEGPLARLREYLIYRHMADALYDDRVEERIGFIDRLADKIADAWADTDQSIEELMDIVRQYSYDVEYDEEEKEKWIE